MNDEIGTTLIEHIKPKRPKRMKRELATIPNKMELNQRTEPSVALMLQSVIDKGITAENVQALDSLVGLYERIQAKNAEREFAIAFNALSEEIPRIQAIKAVPNNDGTTRYRFAPLDEIDKKLKPIALRHGFSYTFSEGENSDGKISKICTVQHSGGHKKDHKFTVRVSAPPKATDTQADGSTHSYAKRGALCDAFGIIVDHDDDARMIGKPIGKAIAEELLERVKATGSNMISFLKYAGVTLPRPDELEDHDPIEFFEQISDERFESLDQLLKVKEKKNI